MPKTLMNMIMTPTTATAAAPAKTTQWYVLYVKPRTEKMVGQKLAILGFEVCVPTQKQLRNWSDRRKMVEVVLFPNYVFVATNSQRRNDVFKVGHVLKYIHTCGKIATLTEKEITMVQQLGKLVNPVSISYQGFGVGEEVEIITGCLMGYCGKIVAINGVSKIQVALAGLQCFANVELKQAEIRRVISQRNEFLS